MERPGGWREWTLRLERQPTTSTNFGGRDFLFSSVLCQTNLQRNMYMDKLVDSNEKNSRTRVCGRGQRKPRLQVISSLSERWQNRTNRVDVNRIYTYRGVIYRVWTIKLHTAVEKGMQQQKQQTVVRDEKRSGDSVVTRTVSQFA